jgi:hypothetical protein
MTGAVLVGAVKKHLSLTKAAGKNREKEIQSKEGVWITGLVKEPRVLGLSILQQAHARKAIRPEEVGGHASVPKRSKNQSSQKARLSHSVRQ